MPYTEPEPGAGQAVLPALDDLRDPGQVNVAIIERQLWDGYEVVAEEAR